MTARSTTTAGDNVRHGALPSPSRVWGVDGDLGEGKVTWPIGITGAAWLSEPRRLAPGCVVSFARRFNLKGAGNVSENRMRFPHVNGLGLGDATPDLLTLACELSTGGDRSVDEIIETTVGPAPGGPRPTSPLRRRAAHAGYLVADPLPPRWTEEPPMDPAAAPIVAGQRFEIPEGTNFLIEDGHFLWFDHGGVLRLRLTRSRRCSRSVPFGEPTHTRRGVGAALERPATRRCCHDPRSTSWSTASGSAAWCAPSASTDQIRTPFDPTEQQRPRADPRRSARSGRRLRTCRGDATGLPRGGRPGERRPQHGSALVGAARRVRTGARRRAAPGALRLRPALPQRRGHAPASGRSARRSTSSRTTSGTTSATSSSPRCSRRRTRGASRSTAVRARRSTPSDCKEFFAENPHVDVTVRGEGEATFAAMLDALDETPRRVGASRRRRAELPRRVRRRRHRGSGSHRRSRHHSVAVPARPVRSLRAGARRRGRRIEPRLSVRLHVLRLGIGDALADPQVRHGPGQGRARVVLEERAAVRLALRRQLRDLRTRRRDRRAHRRHEAALRLPQDGGAELRQEHDEAPPADHRRVLERRADDRADRRAAVHGPGDAQGHQAVEHQARAVRRARRRVPPRAAAAGDRRHDGSPGFHRDVVQG